MGEEELRSLRGSLVSYVPQDPASSLNPALRIGLQLREVLAAHGVTGGKQQDERIAEMMREVALSDDPDYLRRYPHELSGGQQQRVGLAMAFREPAAADRARRADHRSRRNHPGNRSGDRARPCRAHAVAALYVSHDLAVVAALARRVAVMYDGRIVELGPGEQLFPPPPTPTLAGSWARSRVLWAGAASSGFPGTPPPPGAARPAARSLRAASCTSTPATRKSLR
jgi:peptide/nickel transport system ATP-binding protein